MGLPLEYVCYINMYLSLLMAWLLLYRSPFALWLKALYLFSIGMSYQYAVVSRGYMLLTDLFFLIATTYPSRLQHPWRYGALLACLGNSEAFAAFATSFLSLSFARDLWQAHPRRFKPLLLPALGGLIAVLAMLP